MYLKLYQIDYNWFIITGSTVLALVYLRYAIEWQLWYKALNSEKKDTFM
jgi:hypothetical protein